ncbi:Threonine/homoserine efflux transporter RhtA [Gracilibacillus ureilyticus]|uniref:Threonine/homoserine efflux transporter RhtA n=1 Tax=Gracilibacillus ureilyticus TaxID=531814 RepID=A0A1H9QNE3_9BACI|nr:DMT family transporter [Gracilibacillus ureilyticus]SER61369.1 Threonine/homoserine efflux transporter RhtA [Gracilibacillus ureilyticus]
MKNYLAYFMTIAGASFWGLTGLFVEGLYQYGFSAWEVVALRLTTSALILVLLLGLFAPKFLKINIKHLPHFIGLGVLGIVIFNWCYFTVIDQTSLSIAVVLLYTSPVFVAILSHILFNEKITTRKSVSLVFTLFGCALAIQLIPGGNAGIPFQSVILGLLSAFFCALYSIIGKVVSHHYNFLTITVYALMMGSIFIFPVSGIWGKFEVMQKMEVAGNIIGVSIVSTIFAYLLYTCGLVYIESSKAAILGAMEPIVAVLVGVLVFKDTLTMLQLCGIILVISSTFIIVFQRKRKVVHSNMWNINS